MDIEVKGSAIAAISPVGTSPVETGSADTIDVDGRWVLPGLWDHHVHFNQQALALRRIDVSAAASAAEATQIMSVQAAHIRLQSGQPLMGHGFRAALWPDTPTVEMLDTAIPGVPAVLISGDLHCVWLNTAALAMFGHVGHPTGVLREDPCFEIVACLQNIPDAVLGEWVVDAAADSSRVRLPTVRSSRLEGDLRN